jgi:hypothetical protein
MFDKFYLEVDQNEKDLESLSDDFQSKLRCPVESQEELSMTSNIYQRS